MAPVHNDFHFDNLVLDGPVGVVTGIWDFSCVQRGDPAADLRYIAGDSADLMQRVADYYSRCTGRAVDVRAAVLANRLEALVDLPDGDPGALATLVRSWRT